MTPEERIDEVLADLTLDEKIGLLHQCQPRIDRHGLAEFHTGQEALHGMAWAGAATVFPQAIGLGSTWSPELLERIGAAVAREIRACHHGDRPEVGLNVWAPVVDLRRDPRAGRNEEGYAEDPYLTGVLSEAYCRGLAGADPLRWTTAPTLKHFFAYDHETSRVTSSADVRPRLLHEYYLRAFERAIRSGAAKAVMLSYNLVNGRPNHVTPYVAQVLRRWSPDLVVVSDAYAPTNLAGEQGFFATHEEAHAAALRAGLDSFTDRDRDPTFTTETIRRAYDQGLVDEATIDRAVRRLLRMRWSLGEFDPPGARPFTSVPADVVGGEEHTALAREAVRRSIVLLRNDGLLPLDSDVTVAVLGPLSDDCPVDWYSGTPIAPTTPVDGIRRRIGADRVVVHRGVDRVRFRIGSQTFEVARYDWGDGLVALRAENDKFLTRKDDGRLVADQDQPNGWVVQETFRFHGEAVLEHVATGERYDLHDVALLSDGAAEAARVAARADVAVVVVGNHPLVGARETTDRTNLDLPEAQSRLIRAVVAANARTVLVVESGYPYALAWEDRHVPAILWLSHGGQETGNGLADVLFGDHQPGGRLTQTWYGSSADLERIGRIDDYDIIRSGRTYLYGRTTPLYPFGHGLAYTDFAYTGIRRAGEAVEVDVRNVGERPAEEVVQVYVRRVSPSAVHYPNLRLCGFARVEVRPGDSATVTVPVHREDFAHWDVRRHRFVVEQGDYEILAGRSSADLRVRLPVRIAAGRAADARGADEPASADSSAPGEAFEGWTGETLPPRDPFRLTEAVDFDDHDGVRLIPRSALSGDAVRLGSGSRIVFRDVEFGVAASGLVANVRGSGRLEVRLEGEHDALVSEAVVPSSEDARAAPPDADTAASRPAADPADARLDTDETGSWQDVRLDLEVPPGRYTVVFRVPEARLDIAGFRFDRADGER